MTQKFKPGDRVNWNSREAHYDAEEDADGNYEQWNGTIVRHNSDGAGDDGEYLSEYWVRPDEDALVHAEMTDGMVSVLALGLILLN